MSAVMIGPRCNEAVRNVPSFMYTTLALLIDCKRMRVRRVCAETRSKLVLFKHGENGLDVTSRLPCLVGYRSTTSRGSLSYWTNTSQVVKVSCVFFSASNLFSASSVSIRLVFISIV